MVLRVVIDTNVFVAGLRSGGGASRAILRAALAGQIRPVFGNALWSEYLDLMSRSVWGTTTSETERWNLLAALAESGLWTKIHFGWRPNLPDEADNHLIELAIASGAQAIVTFNIRDLTRGELTFGSLEIMTPASLMERLR
jgi:putative PIN family toxin of toxin-antitoxin system